MVLAEAITFDTGTVVVVLLVFFGFVFTATAVVVGGLLAGLRYRADPSRSKARGVWVSCIVVEAVVLSFFAYAFLDDAIEVVAAVAALLVVTVLAGWRFNDPG